MNSTLSEPKAAGGAFCAFLRLHSRERLLVFIEFRSKKVSSIGTEHDRQRQQGNATEDCGQLLHRSFVEYQAGVRNGD